jgi:hypothetical protein
MEQMESIGLIVHGELHTTDASAGVTVPLYLPGTPTARVVAANEMLFIDSLSVVAVAGGDVRLFFDNDAGGGTDLDNGEVIVRGTYAVNGGIVRNFTIPKRGALAALVRLVAPAGVVDVEFVGLIRKVITKTGPTGAPGASTH